MERYVNLLESKKTINSIVLNGKNHYYIILGRDVLNCQQFEENYWITMVFDLLG